MNNLFDKSIKLVLLGESSVGKTSIVSQFVNKQFTDLQDSTIGAAYFSKLSMIKHSKFLRFSNLVFKLGKFKIHK